MSVLPAGVCSCGDPECPELGWPHEWDPVACGDDCVLCGNVIHPADEYERLGCGYAHVVCIYPPSPRYVAMPLLWEGRSD